jgi:hypothetical protein
MVHSAKSADHELATSLPALSGIANAFNPAFDPHGPNSPQRFETDVISALLHAHGQFLASKSLPPKG